MHSRALLWGAFVVFVAMAVWMDWSEKTLSLNVPMAGVKVAVWVAFLAFLGFTIYCSSKEDLIDSLRRMLLLHWGRQVGLDLYLGIALLLLIVYLNEGSVGILAFWALGALLFANLATLLYFALHFDEIVARFIGS